MKIYLWRLSVRLLALGSIILLFACQDHVGDLINSQVPAGVKVKLSPEIKSVAAKSQESQAISVVLFVDGIRHPIER